MISYIIIIVDIFANVISVFYQLSHLRSSKLELMGSKLKFVRKCR